VGPGAVEEQDTKRLGRCRQQPATEGALCGAGVSEPPHTDKQEISSWTAVER
jgi:hypothetical protein